MKRYVLPAVLAALLLPAAAFPEEGDPMENLELELELQSVKMEMAERESELKFRERMRELDLEQKRAEIECQRASFGLRDRPMYAIRGMVFLCVAAGLIIRILAAVWVSKDTHRRGVGSGIWVVIVLLAGLFGVLTYAVVRLGDNSTKPRK